MSLRDRRGAMTAILHQLGSNEGMFTEIDIGDLSQSLIRLEHVNKL